MHPDTKFPLARLADRARPYKGSPTVSAYLRYLRRTLWLWADLTTIMHDLVSEMDALENGLPHDVLMSGYPVLAATMSDGRVRYFDRSRWSAELAVSEANAGLTAGADTLWGFIISSSGQPLD